MHVWRADLDAADARLENVLSPDERARAGRLLIRRDGLRFGRGRGLLRAILGRYLDRDPAQLRIRYGSRGKPELEDAELGFSLSHSQGLLLVAVARGRQVGVDVERIRPVADLERVARRFFSKSELQALASVPAAQRDALFFRCWSRKEAFVKATGLGLAMSPRRFDVGLSSAEGPATLVVHDEPGESARWSLRGLRTAPGHCAALAAEGPVGPVRRCEWIGIRGRA